MSQHDLASDPGSEPRWRERLRQYWKLVRGDRPVGWLLLLWPTWWGLWIAALLTLVTGWDYLQAGLRHMLQEPAGAARVSGRRAGAGS